MPHSKSAKKRVRQAEERRTKNRSEKSALRTSMKKFNAAIDAKNPETAEAALKTLQKKLDKASAGNVLKKGTVSRIKSRMAAKVKATKATKAG